MINLTYKITDSNDSFDTLTLYLGKNVYAELQCLKDHKIGRICTDLEEIEIFMENDEEYYSGDYLLEELI